MMVHMKTRIYVVFLLVFASLLHISLPAQQLPTYILNGTAVQENCNCYQLTTDVNWQSGSVWNKNKIDLNQSFNYIFNVYLGCKDQFGADGIVFVLQPISTSLGTAGQGLGFQNIVPSIGIPIDTWQNLDFNDPPYDHIGIYKNGDLVNGTANTLAGPVQAVASSGNIEDCQWHTLRIIWDADAKILSAEIDGVPRVQTHTDLVKNIFNNNGEVYWGFSASTGGQNNVQKFCTSLNPVFTLPPGLNSCAPASVSVTDSSASFGSIINWWWDFGDGTSFSGQTPPPHAYAVPGYYTIKLNIEANNGCISDTFRRKITVGSIPQAGFKSSPPVICANYEAILSDASSVEYGTINQWTWNFNSGAEQIQTADSFIAKTFPEGPEQIQLTVKTIEGCISEPFTKSLNITPKPATSISAQDACYGDPVLLSAATMTPDIPIKQWYWVTGDGWKDSSANISHFYPRGGVYTPTVFAINEAGCSSDTVTTTVTIYQTQAKLGRDTIVAFGQPLQLYATGGQLYQWSPSQGLNDPNIPDPVAILNNNIQYIVKAYTTFGCPTYDTIQIKAYKGPEIYVPNAFSPDNNGINDRFHPVAVGMSTISYFEVFNRLGQKVFSSPSVGQGWDGNFQGKPQPLGTYVWIIQGQDFLGQIHTEKGTVVLIR